MTDRGEVIPLEWNFVSGAAGISAPPGLTVYFQAPGDDKFDKVMSK